MTSLNKLSESVECYLRDRYEKNQFNNFIFKAKHLRNSIDANPRTIGRVIKKLPDNMVIAYNDTDLKSSAIVWKTNFGVD